jgi:hypothetical protein
MLEACHLYCDHGYVKICLKSVFPIVEYGEQFARLHQASSIKKTFHLEKDRIEGLRDIKL